ncbi:MAG: hypothetical protein KAU03_01290, partial [Candidatus Altiarchaeales archaeon]|nr:hypothetical protein [Candidatus Altiarchaeales archaeon]
MNKEYASIFFVTVFVFSLPHLLITPSLSTPQPHTVYLSSPPNGSFTNMDCGSLQFIYNHTGSLSGVVNCSLYMDDQAVNYTTNVSENTPISVYSNTSWNESQHSWYVNCTNGTAQESSIDFYNGSCWIFTADFTPPSVTINEPANTTYNTTNITLNTTITDDNLDACWYSLDNWATNIPYSCSLTTINASEGPNTVRVGVNDPAGNVNDVEYASFMVSLDEIIVEKTALTPVVNNNGVVNVTCGYKGGTPTYPLMRPDKETLSKWIESYNAAPLTSIKKADKVRGFQVPSPSPGGSYDLFDYLNYTPTERDQGSCGNCWAWAGTGCLEVALDVQESTKDRLSVQYINSCGGTGDNFSCCGGWLSNLTAFYNNTKKAIPWSNTNASWQDGTRNCTVGSAAIPCTSVVKTPNYS